MAAESLRASAVVQTVDGFAPPLGVCEFPDDWVSRAHFGPCLQDVGFIREHAVGCHTQVDGVVAVLK